MNTEDNNQTLRITFPESVAFTLEQEAQMAGISVVELLRRGAAMAILAATAIRDVRSYFPIDANIVYSFTVSASTGDGIVKEFALNNDSQELTGSHISYLGEYNEDDV